MPTFPEWLGDWNHHLWQSHEPIEPDDPGDVERPEPDGAFEDVPVYEVEA